MSVKCEVKAREDLGDYWAKLSFSCNGKPLELDDDLMEELCEEIDFTYGQEGNYLINDNTSLFCEISRYHWGVFEFNDEYYKEETKEVMEEHIRSAEEIFKKQLVRNLGIYTIASELVAKKLLENYEIASVDDGKVDKIASSIEQMFEQMDLNELYNMSDEKVIKIIIEEFI